MPNMPKISGHIEDEEEDVDDLDPSIYCSSIENNNNNHHGIHEQNDDDEQQNPDSSSPTLETSISFDTIDLITVEKFWNEQRKSFIKEIFPDFYIKTLIKFNVFTDDDQIDYLDIRNICDLDNCSDRIYCYQMLNEWIFDQLLNKIRYGNMDILAKIIETLRYDDWYVQLADIWQQQLRQKCQQINDENSLKLTTITDNNNGNGNRKMMKKLLINFPEPISYKIDLQSKRMEINSHLNEMLKNGKGWLIIYGQKGSGKTVLAESSICQFDHSNLTDGIYWITVGNLTITDNQNIDHEEMLRQELYNRLELLYESIEYFHQTNRSKPEKLDSLVLKLKLHFRDHPKSLLVLDDVQSREIFQYFQFAIPVVITTFDK
ncbi:WD repeat-containing 18-like protein, partial [Euroglyphus maynei]